MNLATHRNTNQMDHPNTANNWIQSGLWLVLAVTCFQAAYTSVRHPAAGWLIFGYALGLIRLTDQPNVRRAFYFGLATGFLCYAPQLLFFWRIFNVAAVLLWLVLAFWVGLFAAIICGSGRRWGKVKTAWLIPLVWTGIEFFRSELYFLRFSWLNVGYALPFHNFGMYGGGLITFASVTAGACYFRPGFTQSPAGRQIILSLLAILALGFLALGLTTKPVAGSNHQPPLTLVGIQAEFPLPSILPKLLNQALAKNPHADIFVLSEYTLDGPVPEALKNWCREHSRHLVVGGKDFVGKDNYYNTAFVVGTNGDIVFQQAKSVPIQFFKDGLPATGQAVWNSPWGKIGLCICYDLSYTRVTDELVRQGAQVIINPTMDVEYWGRQQHELHSRVAPTRAAEYGVPIFRVASSGISQAITGDGKVVAHTSVGGYGEIFSAQLALPVRGALPLDRWFGPVCVIFTGGLLTLLLALHWQEQRGVAKTSAGA